MEKNIDFLAIGDTTIDAFIRLKDAHVTCDINMENCQICMNFADKIPYESVDVLAGVGNSANASVSASRLGLRSALIADVGNDQNGKDCIDALKKDGVDTELVKMHSEAKTNYHYALWYGDERTILVKHESYKYAFPQNTPKTKWVYLSSIGGGTEKYHDEIADYLEANPDVKLAFQPGTFQMGLGTERLKRIYVRTELFIVNVSEARRILNDEKSDVKGLLKGIASIGPKLVSITDGPKGAYFYDGEKCYFMPIYPDPKPPVERTGAGDSFASTFVSFIILGKTPLEALRRAPINPMSVVQDVGAQRGLLKLEQIEKFLETAPSDYFPKEI